MPRNLVNLSDVSKDHAARTILSGITLGVGEGERIGVVGGNGEGKSTLLKLIAGTEAPDTGEVTRTRASTLGLLAQADEHDPDRTVHEHLTSTRAAHELTAGAHARDIVEGLLGSIDPDATTAELSGGARRRLQLAQLLLDAPDLLLLDEPTNHLDVEGISWLAGHLGRHKGALLVVTHDRWFLDAVCTHTWEVADTEVHQYEGGYAAYVLARAEREQQRATVEAKRLQLVKKELAWLRRGPPARTSKPKFRIEAANALIADEPPARNPTELVRFASQRLGNTVIELEDVSFAYPGQPAPLINHVTWRLGPGDRLALVGVNGSGKTTLLHLLTQQQTPSRGKLLTGQTVKAALLSQHTEELPEELSALDAVKEIRQRTTLSSGQEITAGRLVERLGFRGERQRTPVKNLSGGERRRLALARILIGEPNVLLLDEPTNDLDIDTLTALEDLLDAWPGTLVVVSHDRYFVERTTDNVYALTAAGTLRHVPGGIEQYLAELHASAPATGQPAGGGTTPARRTDLKAARKELARLERDVERATTNEQRLHDEMAANATDHEKLAELTAQLHTATATREALEAEWLEAAEDLD